MGIGKTAWPSRGQAPGKNGDKRAHNVDKQDRQTWTNNKRRTRGLRPWHEDSGEHQEDPQGSKTWPLEAGGRHRVCQRGQRTRRTRKGLKEDAGLASAARRQEQDKRRGWEEKDKRRTRAGQQEDKRRTREGQEEEKRRTKGSQRTTTRLEKDNRTTRGGQEDQRGQGTVQGLPSRSELIIPLI